MRKAVVHCARPILTTPLDPTKPHFRGASGGILELINY
jgi:hypothetical protein